MTTQLDTIKIKINGVCNNNCCFCNFNQRKEFLKRFDLLNIFEKIGKENYSKFRRIVINGGEPTLHPEFTEINKLLRKKFPEKRIELGTNLRIFEKMNKDRQKILDSILHTYTRLQIGCDDEHKNIDIVEKLIPMFIDKHIKISTNSVNGFYSDKTKKRLMNLKRKYKINLQFSPLAHTPSGKKIRNGELCNNRRRDLLIDSDGNGYFCYQQEFKIPLFNVKFDSTEKIKEKIFYYIPDKAHEFCDYCERFEKDE